MRTEDFYIERDWWYREWVSTCIAFDEYHLIVYVYENSVDVTGLEDISAYKFSTQVMVF